MARGDTLAKAESKLGRRVAGWLPLQRISKGERVVEVAFAALAEIRKRCVPMGTDCGNEAVVRLCDDALELAQAYVETEQGAREGWITRQDGSKFETSSWPPNWNTPSAPPPVADILKMRAEWDRVVRVSEAIAELEKDFHRGRGSSVVTSTVAVVATVLGEVRRLRGEEQS